MHIIPQKKEYPNFANNEDLVTFAQDMTEVNKHIFYESFNEDEKDEFKNVFNKKKIRRYLRNLSSATKNGKKKLFRFQDLKSTCNISYDKSSREESLYVEFLFSIVMFILDSKISTYTKDDNCKVLLGLDWRDRFWRNVKGEAFNPLSINDLSEMLSHCNPSTVIFLHCPTHFYDPISGFGLYLFDENDKLIFKTIYKFFDLEDAPSDAFRLNVPEYSEDIDSHSRCFLSCNFTTP